jgi:hypothetical protein
MACPAEPKLGAYLEFLSRVVLHARKLGWDGAPAAQVADLMDAVHNLPLLLPEWERFDPRWFRRDLEEVYDAKWGAKSGVTLAGMLDDALKHHGVE